MARMAYIGSCIVEGALIQVTGMNSGIESNIGLYDHVVGLRDKNFTGTDEKGPETDLDAAGGYNQIQKKIYRYQPSIFKGKFSGPMAFDGTTLNVKSIIEHAIKGTEITTTDFIYFSSPDGSATKEGHQVLKAVIENLTISVNSGDVATFDVSVVAKKEEGAPTSYVKSDCSKLLTWDKCEVTSSLLGDVQAFSITIKNTVIPIYVSGSDAPDDNYYGPYALRLGMQEVTGTVSTYGFNVWNNASADALKFKLGSDEWTVNVLYQPTQSAANGSSEPFVSSTPFIGASDTAIWTKST